MDLILTNVENVFTNLLVGYKETSRLLDIYITCIITIK